jgi:nucleotide-binding universal stress UspA family protein
MYSTLMVVLRFGGSNADILSVAGELAERFQASVVGVATRQPTQYMFSGNLIPEPLIEQEEAGFQNEADALGAEFREALKDRAKRLEWRASMSLGPLSEYVANQSRCADLVIMQFDPGGAFSHPSSFIDVGDLLMRVGRPALVAPAGVDHLKLDRVVVGWKETPESRRAISDALPFLKVASRVTVVAVADEADADATRFVLDDVVAWLARHGVAAESLATGAAGDEARVLRQVALDKEAELIVAGAFGHSRLREWVFGGVTRDLLLHSDRCTLLSH